MSQSYQAEQTIALSGEECGTYSEMKMIVTFTVQPGESQTRTDPGHEPFIEDVSFQFFRTVRGASVEVSMPSWIEDEFRDADGFDDWLMTEAGDQAEAARDDAADAAYERSREERA